MDAWIECGSCGLRHTARDDGLCPRCGAPDLGAAPATSAAPALPAWFAPRAGGRSGGAAPAYAAAPASAGPSPEYDAAREAFLAPPKRRSWLWLGIVSAIAFVAVTLLKVRLAIALILAAILLVHELGHWIAMRLTGQKDVRIFFIPFFGAVTTAQSVPTSAGARAAIALAGPVPGVVAGLVLAQLFPDPGLGRGVAMMLLYVNVLNLLPIGFLDGGKVVSTLFLSRLPVVEGAFAVGSMIPIAVLFGGKGGTGSGIVGGLAAGAFFAAVRRYRVGREARSLEGALAGCREPRSVPEDGLRALYDAAARVAGKDKRLKGPPQRAALMRELLDAARAPRPTSAERVGYGVAWAAALAVGWATLANAGVRLLR